MRRGIVFSVDAALAAAILVFSVSLTVFSADSFAKEAKAGAELQGRELFALALSEAIVKNRDTENPARGAAHLNAEKNRVESNVLDWDSLKKIRAGTFNGYSLSAMYERDFSGKTYYFREKGEKCTAIERFVVIEGFPRRKTVLGVVVCENKRNAFG